MHQNYARAWSLTLELKVCLHSSPLERELPHSSRHPSLQKNTGSTKFTLKRQFPRSSGHQIFWVFQNMFLSSNSTFNGSRCMLLAQTLHNHILTWYQHQITTQWSSISQINHMKVPIYTKFTFNITISCIQAHTSYGWYMHVRYNFHFNSNCTNGGHKHGF